VQEDVDDDIPRLYDHSTHVAQYDRLRLSDDGKWQEFIQRAYLRGLGAPRDDEEQAELQAAAPRTGDKLWEIGCKVRDYSPPRGVIYPEIGWTGRGRRFPCYGKGPATSQ
jgi:hypothetical protein